MGQKYSHTQLLEVEKHGGSSQLPQNSRRGQRMRGRGRAGRKAALLKGPPSGTLTPATTSQALILSNDSTNYLQAETSS